VDDFMKGGASAGPAKEKGKRKVFIHKGKAVHGTYFGTGKK
jgi:hypothetical protein